MGLQSQAAVATIAKPTNGVAAKNNGSGVFYTVPTNKYFSGYIFWSDNRYGAQINGVNMIEATYASTSGSSAQHFAGPITLYAGTTVGRHASGGSVSVVGCEYDL